MIHPHIEQRVAEVLDFVDASDARIIGTFAVSRAGTIYRIHAVDTTNATIKHGSVQFAGDRAAISAFLTAYFATQQADQGSPGTLRQHFGSAVRAYRQQLDLTQIQVAARMNVSHGYIGQIETGRVIPPDDKIIALALALDVPLDVLFHRAGRLPPDLRIVQPDDLCVMRAYQEARRKLEGHQ